MVKEMEKEMAQGTCRRQYQKQGKRGKIGVRGKQHLCGRR
jgi:hypothetical protein